MQNRLVEHNFNEMQPLGHFNRPVFPGQPNMQIEQLHQNNGVSAIASPLEALVDYISLKATQYNPLIDPETRQIARTVEQIKVLPQEPKLKSEAGYAARAHHLRSIPAYGFEDKQEELERIIDELAVLGQDVRNIKAIKFEENGEHNKYALASVTRYNGQKGCTFTRYRLLDEVSSDERASAMDHEAGHVGCPFELESLETFGSMEALLAAQQLAIDVAEQTKNTGKYLSNYHKNLAQALEAGKITEKHFYKETWSIMRDQALYNPKKLAQVQQAQYRTIERKINAGKATSADLDNFTYFVSEDLGNGLMAVQGIDQFMIHLTEGVTNYADLTEHRLAVKNRFYKNDQKAKAKAQERAGVEVNILEIPQNYYYFPFPVQQPAYYS